MLRPATPADRPALIALALAEDAAWSGAPAVSAEEVGEFVDSCEPGVIFERDGRVAGYAAAGEGGETILLVDPGDDPGPALEALVAWLGERGHHEVDSYARDARRIAWLEANGFTHRRSFFDLQRGIDPPLAPAVWPSGVAIARYRPGEDDAAVHALIYVDAAGPRCPDTRERSLEAWRSTLTPDYRGWVARRDERPVGWVAGRVFSDGRGWVEQLAVARSARGLGLGRALLLHSLAELCARVRPRSPSGSRPRTRPPSGSTATSASRSTANGASTRGRRPEARGEVRADQQDVVVAVRGRHHLAPRASGARGFRRRAGGRGPGRRTCPCGSRAPSGAHERRRLTSPPKMTVRAAARRARSAASSAHCASLPAASMGERVFRWAVHTSTPTLVVTHSHRRRSGPACPSKSLAVGALDRCLGEHRVTEEPAAAGPDAAAALAAVHHPRERTWYPVRRAIRATSRRQASLTVTASGRASRIRATASSTPAGYAALP